LSRAIFHPHVSDLQQAIDYLAVWIETIGGVQRDGLKIADVRFANGQSGVLIERFRVDFPPQGTTLTVGMALPSDLSADWYVFDLRATDGGTFFWRYDKHPGHEAADGRPSHLHRGGAEPGRVPMGEVTLEDVALEVVATHLRLAGR
jgi:hypothetical protein